MMTQPQPQPTVITEEDEELEIADWIDAQSSAGKSRSMTLR